MEAKRRKKRYVLVQEKQKGKQETCDKSERKSKRTKRTDHDRRATPIFIEAVEWDSCKNYKSKRISFSFFYLGVTLVKKLTQRNEARLLFR